MRLFCAKRVLISMIFPTASFHGQACVESFHSSPASTLWFVKVVCTLCIQYSHSLSVFNTDLFRRHLNPFVAFGVICHISTKLNDPKLAFNFFCHSRFNLNLVHSESTFHLLLRSLCLMGLHDSARVVYEYMRADGFLPNNSVLDFLISSLGNAGNFMMAEEVLIAEAEMCIEKEEPVSSFVYNKFLSLLISRSRVDVAVAFFKDHILRLHSFCPDNCSFNIVVGGLCKVGEVEKAFEFFDIMKRSNSHPDIVTYNTLISGLCRVGSVDKALELLREVQSQCEFSPDVVTYTSVISGYCKFGRMQNAAILFDEMVTNGIQPNLFTFNVIIDGFGKKGELASALKMYRQMISDSLYPDVVTFTSLIDGHCRHGDVGQCLRLWGEMNDRKVYPNVFTFSVLISSLCRDNRLNEARDFLNQMSRREDIIPPPFVYNPIIDGFCKAGNIDEANVIVAEMEAKGCIHDKMTFTILILGHCMKGRMFEAIGIYNKMLLLGCAPDHITIHSLVSCLRKAGMACEANKIEQTASNTVHACLSSPERAAQFRTNTSVRAAV